MGSFFRVLSWVAAPLLAPGCYPFIFPSQHDPSDTDVPVEFDSDTDGATLDPEEPEDPPLVDTDLPSEGGEGIALDGPDDIGALQSQDLGFFPLSLAYDLTTATLWIGGDVDNEGRLAKLTSAGVWTEFPLPGNTEATNLVVGPSSVWFLDERSLYRSPMGDPTNSLSLGADFITQMTEVTRLDGSPAWSLYTTQATTFSGYADDGSSLGSVPASGSVSAVTSGHEGGLWYHALFASTSGDLFYQQIGESWRGLSLDCGNPVLMPINRYGEQDANTGIWVGGCDALDRVDVSASLSDYEISIGRSLKLADWDFRSGAAHDDWLVGFTDNSPNGSDGLALLTGSADAVQLEGWTWPGPGRVTNLVVVSGASGKPVVHWAEADPGDDSGTLWTLSL